MIIEFKYKGDERLVSTSLLDFSPERKDYIVIDWNNKTLKQIKGDTIYKDYDTPAKYGL